jgi:hypothetical protein
VDRVLRRIFGGKGDGSGGGGVENITQEGALCYVLLPKWGLG